MKYVALIFISLNLVSHAFAYRAVGVGGAVRARGGAPLNVNRNINVHVDRNVNVVGGGWHGYYPSTYHTVTTTAAVGHVVHTVPSDCNTTVVDGVTYTRCGPTWYRPQYVGTSVQYVVVNPPK